MEPRTSPLIAHVIRLRPGEDLLRSLEAYVVTNGLEAAVVLTCVGSLDGASIRFANREEATWIPGKHEITSLVGTLSASGGSHVHVGIADGDGVARGGHLMEGSRVYTTAEITIGALPALRFAREPDATYGYDELVAYPKE